ncbi:MAG TPA: LuxR C-terminal-related transcriptional regulator [Candidatus Sulfotelmatobacter sp.]|nr:LuxR C-terminal-related transcriptional regulator [Candidatus Sulfotelmatobacter sp.]
MCPPTQIFKEKEINSPESSLVDDSANDERASGFRQRQQERILTAREREVLALLAEGKTVRAAATALGLSSKTVDAHKFNLMRKLGVHKKAQLVMWAIRENIMKVPPRL